MAKFKTTLKEFYLNLSERWIAKRENGDLGNRLEWDSDKYDANLLIIKKVDAYLDNIEIVSIKGYIGSRSYYQCAYKIGKSLFTMGGTKMNNSSGWHSVEIIPTITDKMKQEMIADLHYY